MVSAPGRRSRGPGHSAALRRRVAARVAALVLACPPAAKAHPLHTTLTELTHSPAAGSVEVSMRVFADDFSTAVARHAGTAPAPDHRVPDAAAFAYLSARFALIDARGRPLGLRWCGARRVEDVVWVCLRGQAPARLAGVRVLNRVLLDLYDDQINLVQAVYEGRRYSLLFTKGDGAKRLP